MPGLFLTDSTGPRRLFIMANKQVEPNLFIIFGSTGDLSRRKLLPAIRRLAAARRLNNRDICGALHWFLDYAAAAQLDRKFKAVSAENTIPPEKD
jgi:glucose-6-phosphate 1-dehydrogenase